MTELTQMEKRIIAIISEEVEPYTVDLLARQDTEILDWQKQAPSDVVFTNGTFRIRERYYLDFCRWLKARWDELSWEEQIIFCKYFYYYNFYTYLPYWRKSCIYNFLFVFDSIFHLF